ncbi:MAG: DUF4340 domain-containing protein [Bacteroidales bacterium]|nr:DUF4340 domain-containing protein [Bacteroidales bacterium]
MKKSMGLKPLVIILIIIIGLYVVAELLTLNERKLNRDLSDFDIEQVDLIKIIRPKNDVSIISRKSTESWETSYGKDQFQSQKTTINELLASISNLKSEDIATSEKAKWGDYDVADSSAIFISVESNKSTIYKLLIGKTKNNSSGKTTTFVRLPGEETVYVINGDLKAKFSPEMDAFH